MHMERSASPSPRRDGVLPTRNYLASRDWVGKIGGEDEPLRVSAISSSARLVEWNLAMLPSDNLTRNLVDVCDPVAEFGETDAGDKTGVASSDHHNCKKQPSQFDGMLLETLK